MGGEGSKLDVFPVILSNIASSITQLDKFKLDTGRFIIITIAVLARQ